MKEHPNDIVQWQNDDLKIASTCPVCQVQSENKHLLTMAISIGDITSIDFLICGNCGSGYVHQYKEPDYTEYFISERHLRFYIEQGAGMDILAKPAFLASSIGVRNYLEIGCGFGFGIDIAEKAFGMNARGIDPAPHAKSGKKLLGIDISSEYLTRDSGLSGNQMDMIVAMEVIEHIAEPHSFLEIIKQNLSSSGVFVLSTPNVKALDDRNSPMLLPLLSPGFHAMLFSADALSQALKNAGFKYVSVVDKGNSLFAVATVDGNRLDADIEIDQYAFAHYASARANNFKNNNSLWSGFSYRYFKTLVNLGEYDRVLSILPELTKQYKRRFSVDLHDPSSVAAKFGSGVSKSGQVKRRTKWENAAPVHLPNLFYFIGILRLNTSGANQALDYFIAAEKIAISNLQLFESGGYSDGETAHLLAEAKKLIIRCKHDLK